MVLGLIGYLIAIGYVYLHWNEQRAHEKTKLIYERQKKVIEKQDAIIVRYQLTLVENERRFAHHNFDRGM